MEERDPDYDRLRLKYRTLVRGEMRRRVPALQAEDLKDLEQLVWIAVNNALPSFRGQALFSTWLVGITKNILFSWLRQQSRRLNTTSTFDETDSFETSIPSTTSEMEAVILDSVMLEEAVEHLNENERQVIQLRYYRRLTDVEIACEMDLPLGTVKSLMSRALKKLFKDDSLRQAFMEGK